MGLTSPTIVVHGVLLDAVGQEDLVLSSEAHGFAIENGKAVLQLRGRNARGDVLIGADSIGSVIRRILHPNEPPPRPSGLWAVRGVAHEADARMAGVTGAQYLGRGTEGGIARPAGVPLTSTSPFLRAGSGRLATHARSLVAAQTISTTASERSCPRHGPKT